MKTIRVIVNAVRDGDVVSGTILKQRLKGSAWTNEESINVVSSEPGADRTFILDNDQRLVIEGKSDKKIVFDRDQSAAVEVKNTDPEYPVSPPDTDGDESPRKSAADRAMEPAALSAAQEQERRDAAITAARQKLKENPPSPKSGESNDEKPSSGLGKSK